MASAAAAASAGPARGEWISADQQSRELDRARITRRLDALNNSLWARSRWLQDLTGIVNEYVPPLPDDRFLRPWLPPLRMLGMSHMPVPRLPEDIMDRAERPCPVWGETRAFGQTHKLALFPGSEMGIATLRDLGSRCHGLRMRVLVGNWPDSVLDHPLPTTHWGLMTRFPVPGSTHLFDVPAEEHESLAKELRERTGLPYEIPTVPELASEMLMSRLSTGDVSFPCPGDHDTGYSMRGLCVGEEASIAKYSAVEDSHFGLKRKENVEWDSSPGGLALVLRV